MQYTMPRPVIVPTPPPAPPPSASPAPAGAPGAGLHDDDPTWRFRAWYPRWWLLSALLCGTLTGAILLAQWIGCRGSFAALGVCQFDNWSDWRQLPIVAIAWLAFLLGWMLFFICYVTPIEFKHSRAAWPRLLASLSHIRAVYSILYFYAMLAFAAIIVMWYRNAILPLPFAFCTMILFVTNAQFFHRIPRKARRSYLSGYGVLALAGMILMLINGRHQLVLFIFEIMLVLIGGWAIYTRIRDDLDDPAPTEQPDESELLAMQNEQALARGAIAKKLFAAMLHV